MDPNERYKSMGVSEDTARLLVHNDDISALNNRAINGLSVPRARVSYDTPGPVIGRLLVWGGGAFVAFALLLAFIEATQDWVRASFTAQTVQWSVYAVSAVCIGLRGWLTGCLPMLLLPEFISLLMLIVAGTYFAVWQPDWAYFTPQFLAIFTALVFGAVMVWLVVFANEEPRFRAAFNQASRRVRAGRFVLAALKGTAVVCIPLGALLVGLAYIGYLDAAPSAVLRGLVGPWVHLFFVVLLVLVALDLRRGRT